MNTINLSTSTYSKERQHLLSTVADLIGKLPQRYIRRVAIDGVDGAGKTTFADELGKVLQVEGRATVIRASVDAFHNPKAIRYRKGRNSPEGFLLDSYNYSELKAALLDPLSPGGSGKYRTMAFDHPSDSPVSDNEIQAHPGSILVFDGIFLHRQELRAYWDFSIFIDVAFSVSVQRMAQRDGSSPDPAAMNNRRYVEGQRLYLSECEPRQYATLTINNNVLDAPQIIAKKLKSL